LTIYLMSIFLALAGMTAYRKVTKGRVVLRDFFWIAPLSIVPLVNTIMFIVSMSASVTWITANFAMDQWEKLQDKIDFDKKLF
jgi:low temperature requirement protein LtrA